MTHFKPEWAKDRALCRSCALSCVVSLVIYFQQSDQQVKPSSAVSANEFVLWLTARPVFNPARSQPMREHIYS